MVGSRAKSFTLKDSEMRVKGPFNITATETTVPVDTYYALWAYKSSDFADIGDCNPMDTHGWRFPIDSLMILDLVTTETIWRATVDPANEGMADGSYDIVILTEDVAGRRSRLLRGGPGQRHGYDHRR